MSIDLIDQLDVYGVWLEERCGTVLRPHPMNADSVNERGDVTNVEVTSSESGANRRRWMLSAAVTVLLVSAVAALWSHRSEPTASGALPVDPPGALFVLPAPADGLVLSDGAVWGGVPDPGQAVVHALVVGRPDGDGFVDLVVIADPSERPAPPFVESWTEIDTPAGSVSLSSGGTPYPLAMQQRGDRWVSLTTANEQTIADLLQAVTLTATGIRFEPIDGFVEVGTFAEAPAVEHSAEYTATLPNSGKRVIVSTTTASSPLLMAWGADRIAPVTINGHDGWLLSTQSNGSATSGVAWQATKNRIVGVSGDATDDELADLARRLYVVDEETWTRSLPGSTRQVP